MEDIYFLLPFFFFEVEPIELLFSKAPPFLSNPPSEIEQLFPTPSPLPSSTLLSSFSPYLYLSHPGFLTPSIVKQVRRLSFDPKRGSTHLFLSLPQSNSFRPASPIPLGYVFSLALLIR